MRKNKAAIRVGKRILIVAVMAVGGLLSYIDCQAVNTSYDTEMEAVYATTYKDIFYNKVSGSPLETEIDDGVDTATGHLLLSRTDLSLEGMAGMDFELSRYYDSSEANVGYPIVEAVSKLHVDTFDVKFDNGMGNTHSIAVSAAILNNHRKALEGMVVTYDKDSITRRRDEYVDNTQRTKVVDGYSHNVYGISTGWCFDFPWIETMTVKEGADSAWEPKPVYLHFGSKGTMGIDTLSDESKRSYTITGITGYNYQDVKLEDFDKTVDGIACRYLLRDKTGLRTYFNADGVIVLQKDAHNNTIRFAYRDKIYFDTITDSVGRKIKFTYHDAKNGMCFLDKVSVQGNKVSGGISQKTVRYDIDETSYTTLDSKKIYGCILNSVTVGGSKEKYSYRTVESLVNAAGAGVASQRAATNETYLIKSVESGGRISNYEYRAGAIRGTRDMGAGQERDVVTQFFYVTREYEQAAKTKKKANGVKYDYFQKQNGNLATFADLNDEKHEAWQYGKEGLETLAVVGNFNPKTYKDKKKMSDYTYKKGSIGEDTLQLKKKPKKNVRLYRYNTNKLLMGEVKEGKTKSENLYSYDIGGKGSLVILETEKSFGKNRNKKPQVFKYGYTYDRYRNILQERSNKAYLAKNAGKENLFTTTYTYFNTDKGYPLDGQTGYVLSLQKSEEYYLDSKSKSKMEGTLGKNQIDLIKSFSSINQNNKGYQVTSVSEMTYDSHGNETQEKVYPEYVFHGTKEKVQFDYTYDAAGQQTKAVKTIQSARNPKQNGTWIIEESAYDYFGNELSNIDENGIKTVYTYNEETGEEERSVSSPGTQYESREITHNSEDALKTMTLDYYNRCTVEMKDAFGNTVISKEEKEGTWTESVYDYGEEKDGDEGDEEEQPEAASKLIEERIYSFNPTEEKVLKNKDGTEEYNYEIAGKGEKILSGSRHVYDTYNEEIATAEFSGGAIDAAHCSSWTLTRQDSEVEEDRNIQTTYNKKLNPSAYQQDIDKEAYYNQFDSAILREDITQTISDEEGNIISQTVTAQSKTDKRITETAYEYDDFGRKIKEATVVKKCINGKWLEEKDSQAEYQYDCFDNVTQTIQKERKDTNSNWETHVTKDTYDVLGRKVASYDPKGAVQGYATLYEYDLSGQLIKTSNPVDIQNGQIVYQTVKNEYNQDGQLAAVEEQQTDDTYVRTEYQYDIQGNLTQVKNCLSDKEAQYVQYVYDREGNKIRQFTGLTKPLEVSVKEGKGKDSYTYMGRDYHVCVSGKAKKDAYSETKYEYNKKNELTAEINPEGDAEKYSYDEYGNLVSTKDRNGNTVEQAYDYQNRVVKTEATDMERNEPVIHVWQYDKYGNTSRQDSSVCEYDVLSGQITKETIEQENGKNIEKTYEYDISDKISKFAVAIDGKKELSYDYDYDTFSRLNQVVQTDHDRKSMVAKYTYDENGNLLTKDSGVGTISYTYNLANAATGLDNRIGNKSVSSYQAVYSPNGKKMSETSHVTSPDGEETEQKAKYTYDALGRLSKEERTGEGTISYCYDAHNNRTEVTVGKHKTAYRYNKNEELLRTDTLNTNTEQDAVTIYKNDKNGNQLAVVGRKVIESEKPQFDLNVTLGDNKLNDNVVHHYNALNQLSETLTKDKKIKYEYDANGLRTKKLVNGEVTTYVWNGDQIVLELNKKGNVKKRYIRGNDQGYGSNLIYTDEGEGTEKQYYMTDLHGNVVQLADEMGKVTKTYEYDAFGNEIISDKKDDNPFRYCGEYYDKETESVYLRARYYSPELGRFTTRDTDTGEEENPTSLNLYTYCGNDGVNAWDPSGHRHDAIWLNSSRSASGFGHSAVVIKAKQGKWKYLSYTDHGLHKAKVPISITYFENTTKKLKYAIRNYINNTERNEREAYPYNSMLYFKGEFKAITTIKDKTGVKKEKYPASKYDFFKYNCMDVVVELLQEGKFKKYNAEYHRALSYASTLSVPNNAFAGMKYFVGSIKSYKKANWFKRTFILDPYRVFKYFLF